MHAQTGDDAAAMQHSRHTLNIGFLFVRPNDRSLGCVRSFVSLWRDRLTCNYRQGTKAGLDQYYFNQVCVKRICRCAKLEPRRRFPLAITSAGSVFGATADPQEALRHVVSDDASPVILHLNGVNHTLRAALLEALYLASPGTE